MTIWLVSDPGTGTGSPDVGLPPRDLWVLEDTVEARELVAGGPNRGAEEGRHGVPAGSGTARTVLRTGDPSVHVGTHAVLLYRGTFRVSAPPV